MTEANVMRVRDRRGGGDGRTRPPRAAAGAVAALVAVLVAGLTAGCGSNEVVQPRLEATVGQQLIDLKKARDSGALSEREYEQQRSRLIGSVR